MTEKTTILRHETTGGILSIYTGDKHQGLVLVPQTPGATWTALPAGPAAESRTFPSEVEAVAFLVNPRAGWGWHQILAASEPWQHAYPPVGIAARHHLTGREQPISTYELVAALWPLQERAEHRPETLRLFRACRALARLSSDKGGLIGWWTPGAPREYRGKTIRPKWWHHPDMPASQVQDWIDNHP